MAERSEIEVPFSQEAALVLFDWLSRTGDLGVPAPFADHAEQRVLWDLLAELESALSEPLQGNYSTALLAARASVRDA